MLASIRDTPIGADRAKPDPGAAAATGSRNRVRHADRTLRGIRVIIPTRDQGALVKASVEALRERAGDAERLSIVIVDNGSVDAGTLTVLEHLSGSGAEVLRVDEPFNWSRLNNLAGLGASEDVLLFANDDTTVLTRGWDQLLLEAFEDPAVGIAGARLLYPDETVQHAGVLLGFGPTEIIHEGANARRDESGPCQRWSRTRAAAAVTGAFMAVKRAVFDQLGGFNDQDFAVGYSDIDLCLQARAAGFLVAYIGEVEAIHHESRTRGLNTTIARAAFDQAELLAFRRIWAGGVADDPSLNPHFAKSGADLSRLVSVHTGAVERHLGRITTGRPWAPASPGLNPTA